MNVNQQYDGSLEAIPVNEEWIRPYIDRNDKQWVDVKIPPKVFGDMNIDNWQSIVVEPCYIYKSQTCINACIFDNPNKRVLVMHKIWSNTGVVFDKQEYITVADIIGRNLLYRYYTMYDVDCVTDVSAKSIYNDYKISGLKMEYYILYRLPYVYAHISYLN